jgi:hypothetical protein
MLLGETTGTDDYYFEPSRSKMFTLEFWAELVTLDYMDKSMRVGCDDF